MEARGTSLQRARFFVRSSCSSFRRERYVVSAETVEYGRLAVEASEHPRTCFEQACPLLAYAFALLFHGDLDEAEQQSLAGLRLAEQRGDLTLTVTAADLPDPVYRRRGQVPSARSRASGAWRWRPRRACTTTWARPGPTRAWVAWREQRLDEAEQEARTAAGALAASSRRVYPYPFQWQGLWVLLGARAPTRCCGGGGGAARALLDPTQIPLPDPLAGVLRAAVEAWSQGSAAGGARAPAARGRGRRGAAIPMRQVRRDEAR